jgi:hypothetical protein
VCSNPTRDERDSGKAANPLGTGNKMGAKGSKAKASAAKDDDEEVSSTVSMDAKQKPSQHGAASFKIAKTSTPTEPLGEGTTLPERSTSGTKQGSSAGVDALRAIEAAMQRETPAERRARGKSRIPNVNVKLPPSFNIS